MKRQKIRKAKALAAANRLAYLGLAIGAAVGIAMFALALFVVPIGSPSQMVKAQMVHKKVTESALKTNTMPTPPAVASSLRLTGPPTREANAPTASAQAAARPAYLSVGFDQLSGFPFEVTDQMVDAPTNAAAASLKTLAQIPDGIKALNDKEVAVKGYMLPMNYRAGLASDFLILRNQSLCCYGVLPRITEWVSVRMVGKGVKPIMDQPVTVCGTFHVGDVREHGSLVGIYRLDAEELLGPAR
jgi:hypothetical protein